MDCFVAALLAMTTRSASAVVSDFSNTGPRADGRVTGVLLNPSLMPTISALSLFVPNLDAAVKFYRDVLGFSVEAEYGPEVTKLAHDGVSVLLCKCERATRPDYPGAAQAVPGIAIADVTKELARLKGLGAELVFDAPQDFPVGQFIAVRDPAGNVIELLQYHR
jgi:lactoylglutathione lyase